jgi:predicted DNA-binding transcriptional regulator AlpA
MKYDPKDLIDAHDVAGILKVYSRAEVYKLFKADSTFPQLIVDLGEGRAQLWSKTEITTWLETSNQEFEKTYIYLAECDRHLKIGISRKPQRRIDYLKSDIYSGLDDIESRKSIKLVGYFPGSFREERALQKLFKKYRASETCREWFYDEPEIRKHMDTLIKSYTK